MADMSSDCSYCKTDIDSIAGVDLSGGCVISPVLLHYQCYRKLIEFKSQYERIFSS